MIRVSVKSDNDGFIREFSVNGHANYDEAGKDIVCAAVSAIAQAAILGLTEIIGLKPIYKQRDGHLKCIIPSSIAGTDKEYANIILKTMLIGLKSIEYSYKDYISIIEREVG